MTDEKIASALRDAIVLERDARALWQASGTPAAERVAALDVVRHVTAAIRSLEKLVAAREPVIAQA